MDLGGVLLEKPQLEKTVVSLSGLREVIKA
jgi:hypothetical protein